MGEQLPLKMPASFTEKPTLEQAQKAAKQGPPSQPKAPTPVKDPVNPVTG